MDFPKRGGNRLGIPCLDGFAMLCFEAGKSCLDCSEPGPGHKILVGRYRSIGKSVIAVGFRLPARYRALSGSFLDCS
jgi:hypothetical protein